VWCMTWSREEATVGRLENLRLRWRYGVDTRKLARRGVEVPLRDEM
jgi:hypothetical protein